jgi:pyruvate formate lyase activating enzyme
MHFTAFHPDYRMLDRGPTPPATLTRARRIAMDNGVRYAYTGNIYDPEGSSTWCHVCGGLLIERAGYRIGEWHLDQAGRCQSCSTPVPGRFAAVPERQRVDRRLVRLQAD